jgi:hypothetical protein
MLPLALWGNTKAARMSGRDLVKEYAHFERQIRKMFSYAVAIDFALTPKHRRRGKVSLPERPKLTPFSPHDASPSPTRWIAIGELRNSSSRGDETADRSASQIPRRVAALVVYLDPFRLIQSKTLEEWSASIEQINRSDWDYVKLHEIAGGLDVGLPDPYHVLVGRDGALALPPELRWQCTYSATREVQLSALSP